ncbi:MAG: InlB B-repeat-containing protein [Clostridia bacterium]|nr:InlB B-repeat-containing protein [Clostridia bacterium]
MKNKKFLAILFSVILVVCIAVVALAIGLSQGCNPSSESESTPANDNVATVVFDLNTEYQTNVIKSKEVTIGRRVSQPKAYIIEDNPNNLQIYGWYTSKDFTEESRWDFKKGRVSQSMTLYAKWVELYNVDYYVNGEKHSTVEVFNGDKIEETAEMVMGYKYLGTFTDAEHTTAFDFTKPITDNTNLYVKRSPGIYLSDSVEEGSLSSGGLADYLTSLCGSYDPAAGCEEGWVEEYTIASTGEKCTYVNFGRNPVWGDGYVELSLNLDITESQIIRLTYKNIGKGTKINCYFTSMLDDNTYSLTGPSYNSNFNWPNYIGGPVGDALAIENEQSEDSAWSTVDFNLYEVYKNGYSVWGTSPLLGSLRIEVNYKNTDSEDWANEMLIKSIEGVPFAIDTVDSQEIEDKKVEDSQGEIDAAASLIADNPNGIQFVKDTGAVTEVNGNVEVYNTTEGLLFWAENEIDARTSVGLKKSFVAEVPASKTVNLAELTTLNVTLQNFGYAESIIVRTYNEDRVPISSTIKIAARMSEPKTYSVNLYGKFGMEKNFTKVEVLYTSVGVDNMILFTDISFGDFVPYDTVGLNFYDKFCFGMTDSADVDVEFEPDLMGTWFDVYADGASIESPIKDYDATNEGYADMTLEYDLPQHSELTKVQVELFINSSWGTPYVYELDVEEKGAGKATLPIYENEKGFVKAVRFTFLGGTGAIVIKELSYSLNEHSLPYYQSYDLVYNSGHRDWKGENNFYDYDDKGQASTFTKGANEPYLGFSIYIGYSAMEPYLQTPHTTKNVLMTGKARVTLVYQNRTNVGDIGMHVAFGYSDRSPTDGDNLICQNHALVIDSNMGDYEWSAVSIEVPDTYVGKYLGKVNFEFHGEQITIRAITIELLD